MITNSLLYENSKLAAKSIKDPMSGFVRMIIPFMKEGDFKILDCGSGNFRNVIPLQDENLEVWSFDPFMDYFLGKKHYPSEILVERDPRLQDDFDIVISNYVLNVLPTEYRDPAIDLLKSITTPNLMIEVRGFTSSFPPGSWKRYEDGWVTSTPTFQKAFEVNDLINIADQFNYPVRKYSKKGESLRLWLSEEENTYVSNFKNL